MLGLPSKKEAAAMVTCRRQNSAVPCLFEGQNSKGPLEMRSRTGPRDVRVRSVSQPERVGLLASAFTQLQRDQRQRIVKVVEVSGSLRYLPGIAVADPRGPRRSADVKKPAR